MLKVIFVKKAHAAAKVTACGLLFALMLTACDDKTEEYVSEPINDTAEAFVGHSKETNDNVPTVDANASMNESKESVSPDIPTEEVQTAAPEVFTAESSKETAGPLDEEPESVISSESIVPSAAKKIDINLRSTEKYGKIWETFVPAEKGSEVYAAEAGTVMYKDYVGGYGVSLCLRLENGNFAVYSHFLNDDPVNFDEGAEIKAGDLIGHAGISGNTAEYGVGYIYTDVSPKDLYQAQRQLSETNEHS